MAVMKDHKKPAFKNCSDQLHKGYLFLSSVSLLLVIALFVRMEAINRKVEITDQMLGKRIQKIEMNLGMSTRRPSEYRRKMDMFSDFHNNKLAAPDHHAKRTRRSAQQNNATSLSLDGIRKEIDKKFIQACSGTGKICQVGPSGPPGSPGAPGYPGYKGEKGAPGKTGSHGPEGPAGPQGQSGKVGPAGGQGLKGNMGDKGHIGEKGAKGSRGIKGPPGVKGPFGSKGAKGVPGSMGFLGQKGECVARPSLLIFPKSLDVSINQLATFYCWVQGQVSSAKVTWSRLGSTIPINSSVGNEAVLHFRKVQKPHSGWYMCTVQTPYGNLRAVSTLTVKVPSCDELQRVKSSSMEDGLYFLTRSPGSEVYCDMTPERRGWTLIARFSNSDNKTWKNDNGYWWYDQQVAMGTPTNPSVNADMISPAFWLVSGKEFKITRSDDSSHTPLLQTTGNCLGGQTFRSKVTSYGNFRNGKVWSSDKCLGSCTVQYGGQYKSTDGFQQAECSGNIQSANKIGFWCDWGGGDGAVMMIGGGGSSCSRADHGIGITEADAASFVDGGVREYDFGYNYGASTSYSLNLWIR